MLKAFILTIIGILIIRFCCKSAKAFVKDVDAKGIDTCDSNIYS